MTNGLIEFTTTTVYTGCGFQFVNGSNAITVNRAGYYEISFDADIDPATTGTIGLEVLNNGTIIPGAVTSVSATDGSIIHLHVQTAIHVLTSCKCVSNQATIQVMLIGGGATVDNANIIIEPIKM